MTADGPVHVFIYYLQKLHQTRQCFTLHIQTEDDLVQSILEPLLQTAHLQDMAADVLPPSTLHACHALSLICLENARNRHATVTSLTVEVHHILGDVHVHGPVLGAGFTGTGEVVLLL